MNKEEIYNAIKSLSQSQGFYGRILEEIDNNNTILDKLEELNFTDIIDLVLFLEQ